MTILLIIILSREITALNMRVGENGTWCQVQDVESREEGDGVIDDANVASTFHRDEGKLVRASPRGINLGDRDRVCWGRVRGFRRVTVTRSSMNFNYLR